MMSSPSHQAVSQVAVGRGAGSRKTGGEESVRSVRLWAWPPLVRSTSLACQAIIFFTITSADHYLRS